MQIGSLPGIWRLLEHPVSPYVIIMLSRNLKLILSEARASSKVRTSLPMSSSGHAARWTITPQRRASGGMPNFR